MFRFIALCAAVLLATQFTSANVHAVSINVNGKMTNGSFVTAVCSVGANGQITGTGVLYGSNPATGTTFKYPFIISSGGTGPGTLLLYGKMVAGPAMRISAAVPSGPISLTYVINGVPYTLNGQGTVTIVK